MAEEWLTYSELGERLGVSPEAARQKAIRARWPRRTANDGKAQIRVDIEDIRASTPLRKPKEDAPSDDRPPADEQPADTLTLAALEAHIETLKSVATKADEIAQIERQRADAERVRADTERARADEERTRADGLAKRIEDQSREIDQKRDAVERDLVELRSIIEEMQRPRSWWRRLTG